MSPASAKMESRNKVPGRCVNTPGRDTGSEVPTLAIATSLCACSDQQAKEARVQRDRAVEALRRLVLLKDGPRDSAYERGKPLAWDEAREVVRDLALDHTQDPGDRATAKVFGEDCKETLISSDEGGADSGEDG